jgi:hypothetical protein
MRQCPSFLGRTFHAAARRGFTLAAAGLIFFVTDELRAQQPVLIGLVIDDATGAAIAGASVELLSPASRVTRGVSSDAEGRFTLQARTGPNRVRATRIGFRTSRPVDLILERGDTVSIEIRLAVEAVLLAPIEVVTRRAPRHVNPGLAAFYERMEGGQPGWYMSREQIEARPTHDAATLLHGSGMNVIGNRGGRTFTATRTGTRCTPQVYLDGIRVTGGGIASLSSFSAALDLIDTPSLEGIEVHSSTLSIPAEFSGSTASCGVIAFWTKRGS